MGQLSKFTNVYLMAGTASTTDVLTLEVDTADFEGVRFIGIVNTSTGGVVGSLETKCAATTTGTFVSVGSSNVVATTAKGAAFADIHKPAKRWVSGTFTGAANAHMFLIGELYGPRKQPTTWAASSTATVPGYLNSMVSPTST